MFPPTLLAICASFLLSHVALLHWLVLPVCGVLTLAGFVLPLQVALPVVVGSVSDVDVWRAAGHLRVLLAESELLCGVPYWEYLPSDLRGGWAGHHHRRLRSPKEAMYACLMMRLVLVVVVVVVVCVTILK